MVKNEFRLLMSVYLVASAELITLTIAAVICVMLVAFAAGFGEQSSTLNG